MSNLPRRSSGTKDAPAKKSWLKRGGDIDDTYKKDRERIERRQAIGFDPLRFYLKEGDTCEIIVLDESIDAAVGLYEHDLKDDEGRYGNHESCPGDHGNCILCDKVGHSYFVVFLSILVLREWESKKTGEKHEYSRMLLPLKSTSLPIFRKLEKAALKKHGTMRGMYLVMEREAGPKTARIGAPTMLADSSALFAMYTEKELTKNFGHKAVVGRDQKVLKEANADLKPYDYDALFPEPDADDLRSRFGAGPEAGSKKANHKALDEEDDEPAPRKRSRKPASVDEDEEDDEPAPKKRSRKPIPKDKEEDEDEDEEDDEPAPKKRSRKPIAKDDDEDEDEDDEPAPKKRSRKPAPKDEDEDDDEDDAPPPRKRGVVKPAATKPRSRKPVDDDEDEDEDEDVAPPKRRSGTTGKASTAKSPSKTRKPVDDDDEDDDEDDEDDAPPPKKTKAKAKAKVADDDDDDWFE